jgi:hypothetical protein
MTDYNTRFTPDANLALLISAARTSTATGVGIEIGPTGLACAYLVISAYADTPSITVSIQQASSLNGTYTAAADLLALSAAIAPTAAADLKVYKFPFQATKAFVRAYVAHGDADSITYGIWVEKANS